MKLPSLAPPGARRAALLLHALAPVDQDAVLAGLSEDARARMRMLLDELRELGIPPDAGLLASLDAPSAQAAPASARERLQDLRSGQVAALAHALGAEPPQFSARLLAAHPWPWSDALRAHWPAEYRAAVGRAARQPRLAAVEHAVLEAALRWVDAAALPLPRWRRWLVRRRTA